MKRLLAVCALATILAVPVLADKPGASPSAGIRDLYMDNCSECHGDTGKGDGPKSRMLSPRPADLTSATYRHGNSDDQVFQDIMKGIPGTSMPAFYDGLKDEEVHALVAYLKTLRGTPPAPPAHYPPPR